MFYKNLEIKSTKKNIIILVSIFSIIITSIVYIYITNNINIRINNRRFNEITNDIDNLYNYTETMSDFIVDNYKPPEISIKIQLDLKKRI